MKKLNFCLAIFFSTIILNSCKNNDLKPSDLNIEGKWELESFRGGWTGGDYPPGTGPVFIFQKKLIKNLKVTHFL
ncbi:hypothetical protein [Dyadobacter sp. NIV53]|uniref:hypothetical protein n=1 Tax=Dyadobacter sp. NIV53 TaxID=2861765 RepID=UPI001C86AB54|nr:hypothetical protein [Dyadobacter sp. NIV53]